jgi:hypothetical protein
MAGDAEPRGWSRRRRRTVIALAVVLALAAAAAAVASRGVDARYPRLALLTPDQQRRAPAWTAPCWPTARWTDQRQCGRVQGRVVWVQQHDPDGDGDRHLVVVGRFRTRIVKLSARLGVRRGPRIGARIDAVGWVMRGESGRTELNTQRLRWDGRTWSTESG